MRLIWFIYSNHNDRNRERYKCKYILAIVLGEQYGKLHVLLSSDLSNDDALLIRAFVDDLKQMDLNKRMIWLRDQIPQSFNKAYRTIYKDRIEILDQHEVKKLSKEST